MAKREQGETYSEQETETRIQAALRGARRVGPKTKAAIMKRPNTQRKRRAKRAASVSSAT